MIFKINFKETKMKKFKLKKDVVNLIGCSNKGAPKNLLKGSMYNQIWGSTRGSILNLVSNSVYISSIRSFITGLVEFDLQGKINEEIQITKRSVQ